MKSGETRLRFNPIIPLVRGLFALFCSALSILLISAFFIIINHKGFEPGLILHIIGHLLFAYFSYILIRALLSQTRSYTINSGYIIEINYLTGVEKHINKQNIIKITAETIPYSLFRFKRITLYLSNGKKIRLQQYEFFNFKKIEPALKVYGYPIGLYLSGTLQ